MVQSDSKKKGPKSVRYYPEKIVFRFFFQFCGPHHPSLIQMKIKLKPHKKSIKKYLDHVESVSTSMRLGHSDDLRDLT